MRGDGRTHPAAEEGFAPAPGAAAANRRAMARSERKAHVAATGPTPDRDPLPPFKVDPMNGPKGRKSCLG